MTDGRSICRKFIVGGALQLQVMRNDKHMKRIVKKPEIRRSEIMDVAEELFKMNGYTKTAVEAIIKKAGIAKGTFYYYFKTKEDILQALVEKTSSQMVEYFNSIIELENISSIEKLKLMIRGPKKKKMTSSSVMKMIHKPENRELQEKLNIQAINVIAPLIAKVLQEGKKEGVFRKAPSVEIVQIILAGSQFVLDSGLFIWSPKKRAVFLKELQTIFELLAGLKAGQLHFISKE